MEELIIECSLNEQVTKAENARVPISVDEIVADGLEAARAGAAILHFHARDDRTGALLHPGTEVYRAILRGIRRENPDVILYPTYGASPTPEERFGHLEALASDSACRLDFATIDPGAVNYADYDPISKKIGWDYVLSVTHAEVQYFFALAQKHGIQFSFTVREPGQIRHVLAYRDMGLVADPLFFKITMSEKHLWGVPPSMAGLKLMTEGVIPAGVPYRWMLFVEGGSANFEQLCRHAVGNGGHVRLGVGDSPLYAGRALSNAEQVAEIVAMARAAGRAVATPKTVRGMLRAKPARD
ncbi:3-keto-5-aminohexanoate cleavage protein [Myxococcota bacterium]|nr:3-keto-5-aminohexanoate cleavage protein [Myxococcota bacterium]